MPRGSCRCPRQETRGVLLTGNHYCIAGEVTRKNSERAATSKKRLGQSVPGELIKNTLPWPILGRLSPDILDWGVGMCISNLLPWWVILTHNTVQGPVGWRASTSGI